MIQTLRGTRDILPAETPLWHRVEDVAREAFRRYNFLEIRTPIIEKTDLFARGVGEATDIVHKEMYTFEDRNGDSITLRPEATASVVRASIQHNMLADLAAGQLLRLFYIGPMFRRERPQAGRFRQFYQVGAEVLGTTDDPLIEAEVIEMLTWMLSELGIDNTQLLINSIGEPKLREPYLISLRAAIEPLLAEFCGDCRHRYETNPLRVFDCKVESCQPLIAKLPTIADALDDDSRAHFETFKQHLDDRGIRYQLDPRMVRGLDYYSRTAFEIIGGSLGAQNTLVGGGRYDGLSEKIGGSPIKGFGFAFGLDRMVLSLPPSEAAKAIEREKPSVFIVHLGAAALRQAAQMAKQLRAAGIAAGVDFTERKMKKAMSMASDSGAHYAIIIGDNEIATGQYGLKKLSTGEQQFLNIEEIIKTIKEVN
jgi:histidyl-tRNA synthetase